MTWVPVDQAAARLDLALRELRETVYEARAIGLLATIQRSFAHARRLLANETAPERGDPFHQVSFGKVPRWPEGSMFPQFAEARETTPRLVPLLAALDELQRAIVYEADCQESIDALNTSRLYLYAAGALDTAAEVVVELAHLMAETPTA